MTLAAPDGAAGTTGSGARGGPAVTVGPPPCGPATRFTVECRWVGNRLLVTVAGDLDIATEPLLTGAVELTTTDRDPGAVLFDLAAVSFLDARGVAALVRCAGRDRTPRIRAASWPVHRVLRVLGMTAWIAEHP